MPANQTNVQKITSQLDDMNRDELRQVRDHADNRLSDVDPDYFSGKPDLDDLDEQELTELRKEVDDRLLSYTDGTHGSADASADDEKRKYIAQHGEDPLKQTSAQAVPQPESNEVKDLQNEAAEAEHQARNAENMSEEEKANRIGQAT